MRTSASVQQLELIWIELRVADLLHCSQLVQTVTALQCFPSSLRLFHLLHCGVDLVLQKLQLRIELAHQCTKLTRASGQFHQEIGPLQRFAFVRGSQLSHRYANC